MKSIATVLLLFFTLIVCAQKPVLPEEVRTNIEKRINLSLYPSIVVAILNSDGASYYNFGNNKMGGQPVNEHSIYEIGSITKTFTATLLADEVLKGEMKLDDPAQKYLPETVHMPMYEGKSITLGNLSDHTSSLPRMPSNFNPEDPLNPYADYIEEDLFEFISSYTLTRPIGSEFEYSNLAMGLLGQILARQAKTSYEELMLSKIAKPLQMNETKITLDENMKRNLAYGYAGGKQVKNWDLPGMAGAGAIRSSASDLIKYVSAQMDLTKTSLHDAIMLTHQPRHNKAAGNEIGLNWAIDNVKGHKVINHGGATGGYRAFVGFTDKMGVVVMTNCDLDIEDIGVHILVPEFPLHEVKPKVITWIKDEIDANGSKKLEDHYEKMKKEKGEYYSIDEMEINALGYMYMNEKKDLKAATAVFAINMKEFPASFNVYDSYAEALMQAGNTKDAITNYKKSLELNPGNTNGIEMLAKMGVVYELKAPEMDEVLLTSYDGTYELAQGFNIVITHEGNRLYGRATGQEQFELFPKSATEFYLKVVEARVTFAKNDKGEMGMTLYQNGAVLPGKRI
jgi:D-alanyl-D-alanine-carboxypeptidase/D-alanyl-D-alanine-endopeptidase